MFSPSVRALVAMIALIGLLPADASAQSAGAFARMGFGARGIGLGNALIADASGYASAYYNPALAPFTAAQNLEASIALMSFDRQMQFLQFSAPMRPHAGIAAGIIHAGVTGIDGRDSNGFHTEEYSTNEFALFLAFGTRIGDRLSVGLGLQVFRADYFETLSAKNSIGIDVGLSLRVTENLRLGLVADDLLAGYSWDTPGMYGQGGRSTSDRFPIRLRAGGSYQMPAHGLNLLVEYESRFASRQYRYDAVGEFGGEPVEALEAERLMIHGGLVRTGVEWAPREELTLRLGADRLGQDGFTGARPSAGFTIEQPVGTLLVRAEYALVLEAYDAGAMHLIALRVEL